MINSEQQKQYFQAKQQSEQLALQWQASVERAWLIALDCLMQGFQHVQGFSGVRIRLVDEERFIVEPLGRFPAIAENAPEDKKKVFSFLLECWEMLENNVWGAGDFDALTPWPLALSKQGYTAQIKPYIRAQGNQQFWKERYPGQNSLFDLEGLDDAPF